LGAAVSGGVARAFARAPLWLSIRGKNTSLSSTSRRGVRGC
jgi:hypothetical protein